MKKNSAGMPPSIVILFRMETSRLLVVLFLLTAGAPAKGRPPDPLRLILPYPQPSLELLPLYLSLSGTDFDEQGLSVQLRYAGSSRQALELLLLGQADAALTDAAVFVYLASQENDLLGFLQYFQRSPFVARPGPTPEPLLVTEEDAILSTLLYLGKKVSAPNLALFQQHGHGWRYLPLCQADEWERLLDKKVEGRRAERQPPCAEQAGEVARRIFLSSLPQTGSQPRSSGHRRQEELAEAEVLPGSLWVSRAADFPQNERQLQRFARILTSSMAAFVRYPEQGVNRGLTPFAREWTVEELAELLPVLRRLPWLLQGGAWAQSRGVRMGDLLAHRYQSLVRRMEQLGVIERGLSSRDLLARRRFDLSSRNAGPPRF